MILFAMYLIGALAGVLAATHHVAATFVASVIATIMMLFGNEWIDRRSVGGVK